MSLAANAIVSWETVQAALSYQDSDQAHVEDLINKASTRAETETGRRFRAQDYSQRFTGSGPFLVLPHRPVVSVSSVRVDTDREFAATTELDSADYYVRPGAGYITRYDADWPDTLDSIQIEAAPRSPQSGRSSYRSMHAAFLSTTRGWDCDHSGPSRRARTQVRVCHQHS